jgi:hypothetical protein
VPLSRTEHGRARCHGLGENGVDLLLAGDVAGQGDRARRRAIDPRIGREGVALPETDDAAPALEERDLAIAPGTLPAEGAIEGGGACDVAHGERDDADELAHGGSFPGTVASWPLFAKTAGAAIVSARLML